MIDFSRCSGLDSGIRRNDGQDSYLIDLGTRSILRLVLGALAYRKRYVGPDFQDFAVFDVDRARFDAARFGDVARARAVDWNHARVARFAVIPGNGRGLAQRFGARLFFGFRPKDHVAARNFIGVKPPVFGLRDFNT